MRKMLLVGVLGSSGGGNGEEGDGEVHGWGMQLGTNVI